VVDTGEVSRIGRLNPMVEGVPKVVIDHHPPGDRAIEGLSLRDPGASAAGELVFDLILEAGGEWTPTVVDGIYTAILTDTGSFRFSNATPAAHRIAAELIQRGASPEHLYQRIYGSFPLRRFELLRRALETLSLSHEGRVSYMTIPRDAYRELGCRPDDLEGLVDIPREVEGSEIAILFREMEDGAVKISFRSSGSADVNAVARSFGGGGHVKASGALVTGPLDEVIERVVARAGEGLPPAEGEPEGEEART
jgi:bifunctional oligoribonuclease and PAP phosphatase NrnA